VGIVLAFAVAITSVSLHYLTQSHPSAVASAVEGTAKAAAHGDWSTVYGRLCSADRRHLSEASLADAGQGALLELGGIDHVTVTYVRFVHVSIGTIPVPAAQASGELVPVVGPPTAFTVTTVEQIGGWHVCLSAGGYSSAALGVQVPLGSSGSSPF
jgi:hypothetical protein